jgi:hypothetical protein
MVALATQALMCPAPPRAHGQEPPATRPAAPGRTAEEPASPPARRAFALNVAELYAGAEMNYQSRRVKYDNGSNSDSVQKNRDLRIAEYAGVRLDGYLGDPNLFDFQAGLEAGATQNRFVEDLNGFHHADGDVGPLLRYDFSADVLKTKPLSFNLYARRSDDRVARRFLPSLRQQETEAGVSGLALTGPVTTQFGLSWRDVQRTGNRFEADDEELETSRAFVDSTWQVSNNHKLRLAFEHEDQGSDYQGSLYRFDLKRDELRVEDEIAFGPGDKHRFDTFIRYNQETGDLERDELHFAPRLTLQHTDKLRTVYRYNFYQVKQDVFDVDQHKFDVEALYQASKYLRLGTDAFGLYEHAEGDVQTNQYRLGGDLGYTRPTASGEFNLNLHAAYDDARTHGSAGRRLVRAEAHKMTDVRPVLLSQRNIVKLSILAHSDGYRRIYLPGADYWLTFAGDRVYVRRVPWGRIARDEVVYFDYQYEVPAEARVQSWWTSALVEHRFNSGLVPYYSFEGRFQDVSEWSFGTPAARNNQDRHRIGARFETSWWSAGAEYEVYDDSFEPYDAIHFTGQAALLRQADHSLNLSGELSRYWFEGGLDDRRVWWAETDLKDTLRILEGLSMQTGTAFHWEDDSLAGKTHGVDLEWGLKWVRGYLTVELTVEYDLLAIAQNREQGYGVFLNVRRDLSHLLPGRTAE